MINAKLGPEWAMDDASDRAVFTASAKALRTIAVDRGLRDMIRSSPTLLHALEKAAWRFVAGPCIVVAFFRPSTFRAKMPKRVRKSTRRWTSS